jgi:hypothetical protein
MKLLWARIGSTRIIIHYNSLTSQECAFRSTRPSWNNLDSIFGEVGFKMSGDLFVETGLQSLCSLEGEPLSTKQGQSGGPSIQPMGPAMELTVAVFARQG